MSRICIVSSDILGEQMAGPAIRAYEFARALSRDHDVTIAAPPPLPQAFPFPVFEMRASELRRRIPEFEIVIAQGHAIAHVPLLKPERHLVVDLYDPFFLENLELHRDLPGKARSEMHAYDLGLLRQQLLRGDFFLCASERQRHFWLGMLSALERVNPLTYDQDPTLRRMIEVVPFGLPEVPPQKSGPGLRDGSAIRAEDVVVLWGGGIWNWFDPLTVLRAMAQAVREQPQLKLVFMGTRHPNPSIPQMAMLTRAHQLSDSLGLTGKHVFFRPGWVRYEQRQNILTDADIGISLHFEHIETVYSFRTRVLDYLWAGLPLILTRGDEMADLASSDGLGVVVDYEDVAGVTQALVELASNPSRRREFGQRSEAVSERFTWSRVLEPLRRYCQSPWHSVDDRQRTWSLQKEKWLLATPAPVLLRKAWQALRVEGPRSVAVRTYRYVRRVF